VDKVFIKGLTINAIVGICDWERAASQKIIIDIEMAKDISKAAQSENINDALDYSAVASAIDARVVEAEFLLLETMAEDVAALVMKEFSVSWLQLRISKTQAMSNCDAVGVFIERGAAPND